MTMPQAKIVLSPSDRLKLLGKLCKLVEDVSDRDRKWALEQLIEMYTPQSGEK